MEIILRVGLTAICKNLLRAPWEEPQNIIHCDTVVGCLCRYRKHKWGTSNQYVRNHRTVSLLFGSFHFENERAVPCQNLESAKAETTELLLLVIQGILRGLAFEGQWTQNGAFCLETRSREQISFPRTRELKLKLLEPARVAEDKPESCSKVDPNVAIGGLFPIQLLSHSIGTASTVEDHKGICILTLANCKESTWHILAVWASWNITQEEHLGKLNLRVIKCFSHLDGDLGKNIIVGTSFGKNKSQYILCLTFYVNPWCFWLDYVKKI